MSATAPQYPAWFGLGWKAGVRIPSDDYLPEASRLLPDVAGGAENLHGQPAEHERNETPHSEHDDRRRYVSVV